MKWSGTRCYSVFASVSKKAQRRQRKCLSNGIIATYGIESQDDGTVREQLVLYPKRGYNPYIPLVVIELSNGVSVATVEGAGRHITSQQSTRGPPADDEFDSYQWMMEQMSNDTCYEIVKRAYICEQDSHRGQTEHAKVETEYIQWIARKFI